VLEVSKKAVWEKPFAIPSTIGRPTRFIDEDGIEWTAIRSSAESADSLGKKNYLSPAVKARRDMGHSASLHQTRRSFHDIETRDNI